MTDSDNLYTLMQRLGMAAMRQATTMKLLVKPSVGDLHDIKNEREAREQLDQLIRASIAFTARLLVVSSPDPSATIETARELEAKLVASLGRIGRDFSAEFQKALENLAVSAATYAITMADLVERCATTGADPFKLGRGDEAREQTYKIARSAITFTAQLIVAGSVDPNAARDQAHELEDALVASLDAVPWYEEDL